MALPLIVKVFLGLGGGALLFGLGAKEAGAAKSASGKTMPPWLVFQYQQAKRAAQTNPQELDKVAALLAKEGFPVEAAELIALAKTRAIADSPATSKEEKVVASAITAVAKVQAETPVSPKGAPVPPAPTVTTAARTSVTLSPNQALAKRLSDHLNALVKARGSVKAAKGHEDTALVREFQQANALKNDGKYGPKSALMLGRSWGDVPIVFYWPTGSLPNTSVPTYRSNLETLALEAEQKPSDLDHTRAKMLRLSAYRERGQGYGTGVTVAPTDRQMTTQEVQDLQRQVSSMFFNS